MKKILAGIVCLCMVFAVSACGNAGQTENAAITSNESEVSSAEDKPIETKVPETTEPMNNTEQGDMSVGEFDFEKRTVMLNSGYEMPIVGLGTWTLSNDEAENSVYHALKSGVRLIDTARYYGNEVGVGRGLQRAIDEGIVAREDVFITSKIYGGDYDRAGGIINDALSDLGLDYIDLLLIHQPGADDEGVYKAMEEAVRAGKLRSIGISNYYTRKTKDDKIPGNKSLIRLGVKADHGEWAGMAEIP